MKQIFPLRRLSIIIILLIFISCKEEKTHSKPIIQKSQSSYTIKAGEKIKLLPTIETESKAHFQWTEDYKELSTSSILVYKSDKTGKHEILFSVVNKGGVAEKQYIITVQ